ncbi:MAG TPA: biotin/lipoyl-containing protein, partial [Casimicrobiaceae bacterium]|nr:biotin/lipoyl-containing protein [Casimicrobiaceae bacterium]
MRIEVKVPQLPESVAEATLVSWHKKPGDAVKRDENLIDIETDKVVLELPSPGDGVLVEIVRPDGSTVTSNDVIAVLDTEAKAEAAAAPAAALPRMARPQDRYALAEGDLLLSGTQAVVRFVVEQLRADRRDGLATAAFV